MKKKLLSLFAAFAVMLSLSACQSNNTGQSIELIDEVASETVLAEETTAQTELTQTSNLIFDDINIIEINGQQVSLPFKVEDLGEEYSLREENGLGDNERSLCFRDNIIAFVELDNENIMSVGCTNEEMKNEQVKICGLSCNNNLDDVIYILGEPQRTSTPLDGAPDGGAKYLMYQYNDSTLYFSATNENANISYAEITLINKNSN